MIVVGMYGDQVKVADIFLHMIGVGMYGDQVKVADIFSTYDSSWYVWRLS